jgi:hypothetical protein
LIPGLLKRFTYVLDLENDGHFWKNLLKMEKKSMTVTEYLFLKWELVRAEG